MRTRGANHGRSRFRGFTLTELLIVIGLIALLVSIVLVSVRAIRSAAVQTVSTNSLRQLSLAYSQYSQDHEYRLLPGYVDQTMIGTGAGQLNLTARTPGGMLLNAADTQSWVWRLAPQFEYDWKLLYSDVRDTGLLAKLDGEHLAQVYGPGTVGPGDIGIADHPAYGLNSIFLGGDSTHGGAYVVNRNPWFPNPPTLSNQVLAATRFTQVKNPAKIIVFAPTALASTDPPPLPAYVDSNRGYAELRPPFVEKNSAGVWINAQWIVGQFGDVERTAAAQNGGQYAAGAGLPIIRSGKTAIPVAYLDGSATVESLGEISQNMTRWSPFEVTDSMTAP